ncbi:hypothetical protein CsSME_00046152 [Camellia sinensis var. sinensis]
MWKEKDEHLKHFCTQLLQRTKSSVQMTRYLYSH